MLRVFTPELHEVTFQGAIDPHTPVGQGWLRASHRALDPALSLPYRPYHTHTDPQPLTPGEIVQLDIEIWPTSIVVPPGHRIGLSVRGRDYEVGSSRAGACPISRTCCAAAAPSCTTTRPTGRRQLLPAAPRCTRAPDQRPVLLLPIIPSRNASEAP